MTFDKIEYFEKTFGGNIGRYLKAVLSQFMTKDKLDEIAMFFEKRPIKQAERAIAQGNLYSVLFTYNTFFVSQAWKLSRLHLN